MGVGEYAFKIGRGIGKHTIASVLFCATWRMLPVKRVGRSPHAVAFHHPRPIADSHILVVPTIPFPSLATKSLDRATKAARLDEIIDLALRVIAETTPSQSWKLVINGGTRQDIGQVHGHLLIDDQGKDNPPPVMTTYDKREWNRVFTSIDAADARANNGYSLIIQLGNPVRFRLDSGEP